MTFCKARLVGIGLSSSLVQIHPAGDAGTRIRSKCCQGARLLGALETSACLQKLRHRAAESALPNPATVVQTSCLLPDCIVNGGRCMPLGRLLHRCALDILCGSWTAGVVQVRNVAPAPEINNSIKVSPLYLLLWRRWRALIVPLTVAWDCDWAPAAAALRSRPCPTLWMLESQCLWQKHARV